MRTTGQESSDPSAHDLRDPSGRQVGRDTAARGDDQDVPTLPPPAAGTAVEPLFAGRYRVVEELGAGGMGSVYRALDVELEEEIALKILRPDADEGGSALSTFRHEVKLARRVTHANVARTFDLGRSGDLIFLTMELIVGESLTKRTSRGPIGLSAALRIASGVSHGLAAAHAVGVVHRDLKPDNVLLGTSHLGEGTERAVITDFGIAVLARQTSADQATAGTPIYMAPEQVDGLELDGRADVFSLGVVLYEMLTGQVPFDGATVDALLMARFHGDIPDPRKHDPSIPTHVARLVLDMLARERYARPDAQQVIDRLDALRGAISQRAYRPPRGLGDDVRVGPLGEASVTLSGDAPTSVVDALADALVNDLGASVHLPAFVEARRRDLGLAEGALASDVAGALGARYALALSPERVHVFDARKHLLVGSIRIGGDPSALAARVTSALVTAERKGKLAASGAELTAGGGPTRPEVVELYQAGLASLKRFGLDHTLAGVASLREAVRLAPDDAFVLSALGGALVKLWSYRHEAELLADAEDCSLRALAANADLGEAFNTLGILRLHRGEARAALRAFEEATVRSPRLAEAHSALGRLLAEMGRVHEARARLELAVALAPHDHLALSELGRLDAFEGDWAGADHQLERAIDAGQTIALATHARFALWRRDHARTIELCDRIDASDDAAFWVVRKAFIPLARAIATSEPIPANDERLLALSELAASPSMRMSTFWYQLLTELSSELGHEDEALVAIERAVERQLVDLLWIDRCPSLDLLRPSPRLSRARATVAARVASLTR